MNEGTERNKEEPCDWYEPIQAPNAGHLRELLGM